MSPPAAGAADHIGATARGTYRTVFLGYGGELLLDAFDEVAADGSDAALEETLQRLRGQLVDGG